MKEKRHVFHAEEFQIIYVATLPSSRGSITPTHKVLAIHVNFLLVCTYGKGGEK